MMLRKKTKRPGGGWREGVEEDDIETEARTKEQASWPPAGSSVGDRAAGRLHASRPYNRTAQQERGRFMG